MEWCPHCEMYYDEDNETQPCCGSCGYPITDYREDYDEPDIEDDFDDSEIYEEPRTRTNSTYEWNNNKKHSSKNDKKRVDKTKENDNSDIAQKLDTIISLLNELLKDKNNSK